MSGEGGNIPPLDDLFSSLGTLGQDPPGDAYANYAKALRDLASQLRNNGRELEIPLLRAWAMKALKEAGIPDPAKTVDGALNPGKWHDVGNDAPGRILALTDPEPWPDPVDGEGLLVDLVKVFPRYLALPDGAATALALWTLHAHAHEAATASPILALTSPQKRCGKTTTLSVLHGLVPRSLPASNITGPALFRSVERWTPTLLVDEAESFLRDKEDLRGILNSGHHKAGAFVVRTVGDDHDARLFRTWAPKAVALIGKLPPTLLDRSIEIPMRRRGAGENIERLRLDRLEELEPLRRRAWTWARDTMEILRASDPTIPGGLHDRAADNWRPLLAIADTVGGPWPERARRAAVLLSGQVDDDDAASLLLEDLYVIFTGRGADKLASKDLVEILATMEDRPWPEWRRGSPITTRGLAKILKPYGIHPRPLGWGGLHRDGTRGYEASDFTEAWERYLSPESSPSQVQEAQESYSPNGFLDIHKCKSPDCSCTYESRESHTTTTDLAHLRLERGVPGEKEDSDASEHRRKYSSVTESLFEEVAP